MNGSIKYIALTISIISFQLVGCINIEPCENPQHHFDIEFSVSPEGNLYNVGDTISVHSVIGDALIDQVTGDLIDCGDYFLFPLVIGILQYDSTAILSANHYFNNSLLIGTVDVTPSGTLDTRYRLEQGSFKRELELFYITENPGIYTLRIGYIGTYYEEGFLENDDECKRESALLFFNINNDMNLGYELIEPSGYFDLPSEEEYTTLGLYSFEVIE